MSREYATTTDLLSAVRDHIGQSKMALKLLALAEAYKGAYDSESSEAAGLDPSAVIGSLVPVAKALAALERELNGEEQ